ncbi:FecCD family ABC transporter permease [Mycobacterium haemophilum]|uniref:Iron ABC transporter n=1 Tax=Mycobacterium haemophilum TaxID=29311 RepID=A0A0I9TGN6_9MYCO|nr:iron ABC transporter permease [Mycobacterium haemophilum]KLO28974.1 iron ABC transporter [Mycobacterium haemophilum]KLO35695.1 iron ABC transporter [Mycobacterium haemophilum]KLO41163.1 iron ABC transporter [Mycobacterium haemophilum]KLO49145.1 iron ABC transporter [Mycobacterium haemophilum]
MPLRLSRAAAVLTLLAVTVVLLAVLALAVGPVRVPLPDTIRVLVGAQPSDPRWQVIVANMRLPRVLTAIAAGSALAVAGLQMQTLFRNTLADPYVLGVCSGACLGVAVAVIVGAGSGAGFIAGLAGAGRAGTVVAAVVGAALVLAVVLTLAHWVRSAATLLLIGVMVGAAGTAATSVLVVYADPRRIQQYLLWGLGSFAGTSWSDLRLLLPLTASGLVAAALTIRPLNALLLGEGYARTMGIDVRRARVITVASGSLLAGVTTAFCGPIAFVGLVVPHVSRIALGTSDHRVVLPGVVLMGAAVALGCAVVTQLPGTAAALPVNAITALIGAPIVVAVLMGSRRGWGMQR